MEIQAHSSFIDIHNAVASYFFHNDAQSLRDAVLP